jgi:hypothetical protein
MDGLNILLKRVSGNQGPPRNTVGSYFQVSRFCKILKITHKTSPPHLKMGRKII